MDRLIEGFGLDKLSRAPARFDEGELRALNAKLLHGMAYEEVAESLRALGIDEGPQFWEAIRGNVASIGEARQWHEIVRGNVSIDLNAEDKQLLSEAKTLLPPEPWDRSSWTAWTNALKERTGRTGKALFGPLRRALTGRDHGPELAVLMPLIGKTEVERRLTT